MDGVVVDWAAGCVGGDGAWWKTDEEKRDAAGDPTTSAADRGGLHAVVRTDVCMEWIDVLTTGHGDGCLANGAATYSRGRGRQHLVTVDTGNKLERRRDAEGRPRTDSQGAIPMDPAPDLYGYPGGGGGYSPGTRHHKRVDRVRDSLRLVLLQSAPRGALSVT